MSADQTAKPWLLELGPPEHPSGVPAADSSTNRSLTEHGKATDALPHDALGLALSGGGIRSASFCLGLVQALARSKWLPKVDFLSTVSGGGYTGAFLGRFFDQCGKPDGLTGAVPDTADGAGQDRVARDLVDSRSASISWLRRHANYLSPSGHGEMATNIAGFWRNLISVYFVLAFFLVTVFGLLNAIEYSSLLGSYDRGPLAGVLNDVLDALTPITGSLMVHAGPWAVIAELVLWLGVLPLMLAYWLVSQDLPETFIAPVLASAAILAGAILLAAQSPLGLVVLASAVIWALIVWAIVRRDEGHFDQFNPSRLALARNHLTQWLAFWLTATVGLLALAVIDGLGRWLAWRMLQGGLTVPNIASWLLSAGASVFGLATGLRVAIRFLVGESPKGSSVLMFSRPFLVAALITFIGVVPPLVVLAFISQTAYELGNTYNRGLAFTGVTLVVSLLLGLRACVEFINRSGPLNIYASRLARAFLGAVNPARRTHPEGRNVTHVVPGDDVPLTEYAPHAAGGPLHLINCAVNETIDVASQRGLRDRQAENMAVGPAGVSVAQNWHALWLPNGTDPQLVPLAEPGEVRPHPFLAKGNGPVRVEGLSLREWMAISGAAFGPGMGRRTGLAHALLLTLANLRLGYWWNSGLNTSRRANIPGTRGIGRRLTVLFSTLFQAQALLLSELTGRFAGPWERYWNLSDGGNFENTGAYELLRRRVPFVIACDAGEDPQHRGSDLARLVRLARIDLGAEITEVAPTPAAFPAGVAPHIGTLADLLVPAGQPSRAHAALFLVRYPQPADSASTDPWARRTHTWLLYIKATVTGDEPPDVLNYEATHPDFPNETTLDQVFDEPQWESYRALGDHIGTNLFVQPREPA
ncbi:hypothetical protein VT84_30030 [Gemmata sp. SH-PL17]|uniref:hypothetical protein n=1 Tax=Gemmata sp. SH-PL17 TaxID=1630693 RepID=UPI00078C44F5|nr:hypothetical protein [Gemmata sp. SH-PL17]AMV28682.1 hypothetical protein VT84_30030 [Gemmata sp. SH-PL17]